MIVLKASAVKSLTYFQTFKFAFGFNNTFSRVHKKVGFKIQKFIIKLIKRKLKGLKEEKGHV